MKTIAITITAPDGTSVAYTGLFPSTAAAICDALDHATSPLCGITTKPWIFNFAGSCPARERANSCEEVRAAIIGELSKRPSKHSKLICDIWRAAASPWTKRRSDLPRQDPALY